MPARIDVSQRMPFVRIDLQLVRLPGFDHPVDQLTRVVEMHVLVYLSVDYEQAILSENNDSHMKTKIFIDKL